MSVAQKFTSDFRSSSTSLSAFWDSWSGGGHHSIRPEMSCWDLRRHGHSQPRSSADRAASGCPHRPHRATPRMASLAIGVIYLLVGVIGLFNIDFIQDLLFLNAADHVLHFGTGFLALAVGLGKLDNAMG